ncbi:MAG TPA: hypothetical protein VIT67_18520 [Povalibacter sp.]
MRRLTPDSRKLSESVADTGREQRAIATLDQGNVLILQREVILALQPQVPPGMKVPLDSQSNDCGGQFTSVIGSPFASILN